MKIPKSMKTRIREERDKVFLEMSSPLLEKSEWDELNKKYQAYNEMLQSSWKLTPDTLFMGTMGLLQVLLILNYERFDIVRSKAMGFIFKGRI